MAEVVNMSEHCVGWTNGVFRAILGACLVGDKSPVVDGVSVLAAVEDDMVELQCLVHYNRDFWSSVGLGWVPT